MALTDVLKPADVLVVRGSGLAMTMVRLGAALAGKPNLSGHVAVMHHFDSAGVPWGLEGRPGGVGWVDLRPYIASPWTLNNCDQPDRTDDQRALVCADAQGMLGTRYDWLAILGDGFDDVSVKLWNLRFAKDKPPGEVVCSSYAAYIYAKQGWASPQPFQAGPVQAADARTIQPGDWDEFILTLKFDVNLRLKEMPCRSRSGAIGHASAPWCTRPAAGSSGTCTTAAGCAASR